MPDQYDFSPFITSPQALPQAQEKQYDYAPFLVDANKNQVSPNSSLNDMINPESASKPIMTQIGDMAKAIAVGGFHGVDHFATTLGKLGSKAGVMGNTTPKDWQDTYDSNTADYNKSSQDHPIATGLGYMAGTTAATAPLFAVPSVAGAGIGSLGAIGRLGVNAASMGAQGAAVGGVATQAGQDPNQILNPEGAKQGAVTGTFLGSTIHPFVSSYFDKTAQLAETQANAAKVGYGGKVFDTDQPSNSWVDAAKNWTERNILQKLPSFMGTGGARDVQGQQVQDALKNYVSTLSQDTTNVGPKAVGNILDRHHSEINQQYNGLWNDFVNKLPNKPIPTPESDPIVSSIQDIIKTNSQVDTGLTLSQRNLLQSAGDYNTPGEVNQFKKQVWDVYSSLQQKINKGSDNPVIQDLANQTRQLYWSSLSDMKNGLQGIQGDQSPALQAFNTANQFTINMKQLFDPKARPQLISAIKDAGDDAGKVTDFMKWLNSPSTSASEVGQVQKVLGKTGQEATSGYGLQQLYTQSMKDQNGQQYFDVNTFLNGLNQIERGPQQKLYQPALDAMQGLRVVAQQYAKNTAGKAVQGTGQESLVGQSIGPGLALGAGAVMKTAGLVSPTTALILASPTVLSSLAANSPLKNTLISLSKLSGAEPTSLMNFLSTKATDSLTRAGVMLNIDKDGNTTLDKPKEGSKIGPLSMNSQTPMPGYPQDEDGLGLIPKGWRPNPINKENDEARNKPLFSNPLA